MADSITTQTTLKAEFLILLSELERLVDSPDFSGDVAAGAHEAAWTAVLRDLKRRRPSIDEADVTDTDELQHAAHLYVLHLLYRMSSLDDDQVQSKRWYNAYRKEISEVQLTISGSDSVGVLEQTVLVRG